MYCNCKDEKQNALRHDDVLNMLLFERDLYKIPIFHQLSQIDFYVFGVEGYIIQSDLANISFANVWY